MIIPYASFFRRYGIRKPTQLTSPPVPRLQFLDLPRNSIFHYVGTSLLDHGPTEDENILKNVKRTLLISTVTELSTHVGNPRHLPINIERLAKTHRQRHPRFRPLRGMEMAERDQNVPVVFNYAFLIQAYRYQRNYFASYYQHKNILDTVFSHMQQATLESDRQQFVEFDLPKVLPSVGMLLMAEKRISTKLAGAFSNNEMIAILELWKWIGPNRAESVFGHVPDDKLNLFNIIFKDNERWIMLNLGMLNKWRAATKEELEMDPTRETHGWNAGQLQKRFLRLLMVLADTRTIEVPENLGDEEPTTQNGSDPHVVQVTPRGDDNPGPASTSQVPEGKTLAQHVEEQIGYKAPVVAQNKSLDVDDDMLRMHPMDQLEADLAELEKINERIQHDPDLVVEDVPEVIQADEPKAHEDAIQDLCHSLADAGALSASEYRRLLEASTSYKKIVSPDGKSTLDKFIEVSPELTQITASTKLPDNPVVVDKSMQQSTLLHFDSAYLENVLPKDVAAMVANIQQAGIIVLDYKVDTIKDISGSYDAYTVRVKPLQGTTSLLRFRLPHVDADGTYTINGVNYRTRKQKGDMPIRKIRPNRVGLTSYYGKTFVDRDEKKVNDYGRWLRENIMSIGLQPDQDLITNMVPGDVFYNDFKAPKLYSTLAMGFRSFHVKFMRGGEPEYWFMSFDAEKRGELIGDRPMLKELTEGRVLVGICGDKLMWMAPNGALYEAKDSTTPASEFLPLPSLEETLGLPLVKAPVDFATVNISGRPIPVGIVLGYLMGLDRLVKRLRGQYRVVPAGTRSQLQDDEWALVFQDESWVFSRDNAFATMVLAGWREYEDVTRQFNAHEFNRRDVYFNVLDDHGFGVRFLREIDTMSQLFIDPITKELLEGMKEPAVFTELVMKAAWYLLEDAHPGELDASHMRIKGYERFAGFVYAELVSAIRTHNARSNKQMYPLEMNPYAVWFKVMEDPAKNQNSEINPIQNLKELEAVTYSGSGGRSGRTMVKRMRAYDKSDMGVVSEATMDSSDVGINTFLSADPQFNSLRGTTNRYEMGVTSATSLLSTSALLAPAATQDAMKRANFISIQNGHGVACEGYHQSAIRTGYEAVIGQRTGDLHCFTAKKPGKVVSRNEFGIIVEYDDGKTQGVELGRRYGAAAGLVIPHAVVSQLSIGDTFVPGQAIAYNSGFFEPDFLNPGQVVFKNSMLVSTVLLESANTLEDSSEISARVSRLLRTQTTKVRTLVVDFNQEIHKLVQVGQAVEYESILCIIEDAVSAGSQLMNTDSVDTLRVLSNHAPQSKVKGTVERIEVFYNGEPEDMGRSLRELVSVTDKQLAKRNRSAGRPAFTGSVDENFRIDNEPLLMDTAAIKIYITSDVDAGVGDKGVFSNQLKTVFGRVFETMETENGTKIDAVFGAKSVDDRIVNSPYVIGTTNVLLRLMSREACKAYFGS